MLRNYFLINIVLVVLLGLLGYKFYKVVTYSMPVPAEASVAEGRKPMDIAVKFKGTIPSRSFFQIISDKDLFRPTRTAPADSTAAAPVNTRAGNPKLFATIVGGSESIAIIEDPNTRKTKSYRLNDLVGGFVVSEILKDRVVLSAGDEKIEVKLREDKGIKTGLPPQPFIRQNNIHDPNVRTVPARRIPPRRIRRTEPNSDNVEEESGG